MGWKGVGFPYHKKELGMDLMGSKAGRGQLPCSLRQQRWAAILPPGHREEGGLIQDWLSSPQGLEMSVGSGSKGTATSRRARGGCMGEFGRKIRGCPGTPPPPVRGHYNEVGARKFWTPPPSDKL